MMNLALYDTIKSNDLSLYTYIALIKKEFKDKVMLF